MSGGSVISFVSGALASGGPIYSPVSAAFPLPVTLSGGIGGLAVAGTQADASAVGAQFPVTIGGVDYVTGLIHRLSVDQTGNTNVAAAGRKYQLVAAGSAAQALGASIAGNALDGVWLFPTSLTPGAVSILDGATAVWTWPAAQTLFNLAPIFVPLNLAAVTGWKITTPADFSALAWGRF